jgi:hypothetical protein
VTPVITRPGVRCISHHVLEAGHCLSVGPHRGLEMRADGPIGNLGSFGKGRPSFGGGALCCLEEVSRAAESWCDCINQSGDRRGH